MNGSVTLSTFSSGPTVTSGLSLPKPVNTGFETEMGSRFLIFLFHLVW